MMKDCLLESSRNKRTVAMSKKDSIKFLVMDVDGTLTDGKIHISGDGELYKSFNVKDGYGIKEILPSFEIRPIVITARESKALMYRCKELQIVDLCQNEKNKVKALESILARYSKETGVKYDYSSCAYIGDDVLDLQCMNPIKAAGGLVGCPNDAVLGVKEVSDYICSKNGGEGAVREFIDWILAE